MLDGPGYVEIGWKPEKAEDERYLQWCEVGALFMAVRVVCSREIGPLILCLGMSVHTQDIGYTVHITFHS